MSLKKFTAISVASALVFSLAVPTIAQDMLTGLDAIEKRQELMKLGGRTLRGAGAATGDDAIAAAQTLVDNFDQLVHLWPEDSQTGGKTEALPNIWTDTAGFEVALATSASAAAAMLAAAQAGDSTAYIASLKVVGGSCGACHGDYRKKK